MESITLGQVLIALVFIMSLISNAKNIIKEIKNPFDKKIKEVLEPIREDINHLEMSSIKTDLVNFMCLAEQGNLTHEQKLIAHELYDRYCEKGGNSYIHDEWERLKKEGKI